MTSTGPLVARNTMESLGTATGKFSCSEFLIALTIDPDPRGIATKVHALNFKSWTDSSP